MIRVLLVLLLSCLVACESSTSPGSDAPVLDPIYQIAVVVHVLHHGEPEGVGANLSTARIVRQIEILNEDFRRKPGTRGFNEHPAGADARIEFVLARTGPDGGATDGIHRVDITQVDNPVPPAGRFDHLAHYGYWDHRAYMNIWLDPLPESTIDILLGQATGPSTDLPGADLLLVGEPVQSEGVIVNVHHFGETDASPSFGLGRTLTHEVGHYLGLLHLWGNGECVTNDHCSDTPPVSGHTVGCPSTPPLACDGTPAMVQNYMDFTADACMNLFTRDQVVRMRHVMENSADRMALRGSTGLGSVF